MKKLLIGIIISLISISTVSASSGCFRNRYGQLICNNHHRSPVVTHHSHGHRGAVTIHHPNGVRRTYGSHGGRAITKNGRGVVQGPGGTTCARGRYNSGCR